MATKVRLTGWAAAILCMAVASVRAELRVETVGSPGSFAIVKDGKASEILVDPSDHAGVRRAAGDLSHDIERVSGVRATMPTPQGVAPASRILVGTLGQSPMIDRLVAERKIDVNAIKGKWEAYLIEVVNEPTPGAPPALVIIGSDKRGTIYGIYEVSEKIGVSPWHWWADVPPRKSESLFVSAGRLVQGPPKVKYRGIFINDEEPALGPWSRSKFGGVNSKMYAHMFELILRLRGNYLWPAMWGKAFNEDDPENPRLADEYGIVMGTSHHEPMIRAQKEWTSHRSKYGNGQWNYATNEEGLKRFWREGIERNKSYESLVTIGMRGDGDEPMVEGGDMAANSALLEKIVADQRRMLTEVMGKEAREIPQLWALYKEVADYYAHGMRVPDDVTLLWCDDNWGNIRRLPTPEERQRSGGAGIYYHFDYVGSPRSYKWINTNPLPKVWEQMNLAYQYGADRIWIVNVGDLKPMELPIDFFLRMAWNPEAMSAGTIRQFTIDWATRQFGPAHAGEIAEVVSKYAKYNAWRKPELLDANTFSHVNYREAERVVEAWQTLTREAERIGRELPAEMQDAYFQLVLYPTKGSATVAELHVATGQNRLYAKQGRASANERAARVRELFALDKALTDQYHTIAGGKWRHMMAQTRIGYTSWSDPRTNIMPTLSEVQPAEGSGLGVAVEGSDQAWPGGTGQPKLPAFDAVSRQRSHIDLFNRGTTPFDFTAVADQPWIKLGKASGNVTLQDRIEVQIDWNAVPQGNSRGVVTITQSGGETVNVAVEAVRRDDLAKVDSASQGGLPAFYGGLTGATAIVAANAHANIPAHGVRWEKIPDYGRGDSAVTVMPVTAASIEPTKDSPRLEYKVLIPEAGAVQVHLVTSTTLDFMPGRGLRVAVSFDDQPPVIVDAFANQTFADPERRPDKSSPAIRDWHRWVSDNARTLKTTVNVPTPGVRTLKVWVVDPGMVIETIVLHGDKARPSYFGPPPVGSTVHALPPSPTGR